MNLIQRNFLSLKQRLSLEERLLLNSIKNQLCGKDKNLFKLATNLKAKEYSLFAKDYYGFNRASKEMKSKYITTMQVYDYFTHSSGGPARYLEQKLALLKNTCTIGVGEVNLPLWLSAPDLFKKVKFSQESKVEKEKFALLKKRWKYISKKNEPGITFDLTDFDRTSRSMSLFFAEVKSSITTEGVGGREGIWGERKFALFFKKLAKNRKLYHDNQTNEDITLFELLKIYKVRQIKLFQCIPFDDVGRPATQKIDLKKGFYRTSQKKFNELLQFLRDEKKTFGVPTVLNEKLLGLKVVVKDEDLELSTLALYGEDIFKYLLRIKDNIQTLRLPEFDDIWLSIFITINERDQLIKYGKNLLSLLIRYIESDRNFGERIGVIIQSGGNINDVKNVVNYLVKKDITFKNVEPQYLADLIYFYSACFKFTRISKTKN